MAAKYFYPRDAIASAAISYRRVSVCLSITNRCSTETGKRRDQANNAVR